MQDLDLLSVTPYCLRVSKKARPDRNPSQRFVAQITKHPRWAIAAAVSLVAVVAGLTTCALWPEPPRQREYLDATACLLTGENGILDDQAKPVWATMQEASVAGLVRVQYLQVQGPQTARNASTFATSLAGGRCSVIISVGEAQTEASASIAAAFPAVQFLNVGDGEAAPNLQVIPASAPDAVRAEIHKRMATIAEESA